MGTAIEWTEDTWNPVTGCSKVSPGCAHCYAEGVALRFWKTQYRPVLADSGKSLDTISTSHHEDYLANGFARPRRFTDVQCHEDRLDQPLRWKKPRRIFVNSMSDLFHEDVPDAFIDQVFAVMVLADRHTFQVLTKRAQRMRDYFANEDTVERIELHLWEMHTDDTTNAMPIGPLKNVWLGVSVENQHFADQRIPLLLQTPAAIRFLSCEPLLGGLDIAKHRPGANRLWVIVGGESGPSARPCEVGWVRSIVRQCQESDVPVFVKQLGAVPIVPAGRLRHYEWGGAIGREARFVATDPMHEATAPWRVVLGDRKGGDMSEWPEDLRVREFPDGGCRPFSHDRDLR